ncbi:MAG: AGE family epimerase/isomerase [Chitinophagaceae bacterium]|nr:AGE family epimerase/isomerase [Chitinophagaceae bacterium]
MQEPLTQLQHEVETELGKILNFWITCSIDSRNGGFFGRIDEDNKVYSRAPKGSVLNARILWSFSAAGHLTKNPLYADIATRAYDYIIKYFIDNDYGGVYWTVNVGGEPLETKKQIYASAFAIYALSEYYRCSQNNAAKEHAINLYKTLMRHSHDSERSGFFEAFTREWQELGDQRLSAKDANEKKTTNTNLHVLEAFCNLFSIWPDEQLKEVIVELLSIFVSRIIDPHSGHLRLFFDPYWNHKPDVISYGHDIEASWLLQACAEIINDQKLVHTFRKKGISLADAAMRGLDSDGGLWYEFDLAKNAMVHEKHWWPQAEALVGFFNAWQVTSDTRYLDACINTWKFICSYLLNPSGEWYWGVLPGGTPMKGEDKVGIWKCPYHNSRACMELLKRL